ncbi:MAG: serine/threonine-protein kinase [Cyanobacteriota bacterium]|nr:serine/threonine-protein kinase [Cyanobacteriota bacterium]
MEQFIGEILHDRYRIQSVLSHQIGRRTFLANDLQTGLLVVIKLLLFSPDLTWEHLKLFEREAEVLKSLNHPAIPQYLDYFDVESELGKGFALVQTYIEAKSLLDWIQSGRTFSEADLKVIAKELLKILDYLHSRQPPIIHRDIKPSNILLADRSGHSIGQVYLIDLGSVQTAIHSGTQTIVGTYGYMPFEQFGGQTTPASDLYALGATLIYLTTGQHPEQLPQQQMRIQFEEQVNLSPYLINWLKSMTEPSLDLRLKSANLALEALETSNLPKNQLTVISKPNESRIQVTKTREMLEILVPEPRLDLVMIIILTWFGISLVLWTVYLYLKSLENWGFETLLVTLLFLLFFGIGLTLICTVIFSFFGRVRLRIDQSNISKAWEIFGLKVHQVTASRKNITKIEYIPVSYEKEYTENTIAIPAQIRIWAGTLTFRLVLTPSELDWLAQELRGWLNVPISGSLSSNF